MKSSKIEQVALNKSRIILDNILQNTQKLQLFKMIKQKLFANVFKNANLYLNWAMKTRKERAYMLSHSSSSLGK